MQTLDRTDPFWKQLFFEAWRQMLARLPPGEQVFQGPAVAKQCAGLADDAFREAVGLGGRPACNVCKGVGCDRCAYTGLEPQTIELAPATVQAMRCHACDGTGCQGKMGDDGKIERLPEVCEKCGGMGIYSGKLRPAGQPKAADFVEVIAGGAGRNPQ